VLQGEGWRRNAVGETSSGGTPDKTNQSHVVARAACVVRERAGGKRVRLRAAGGANPGVAFLKALLFAIACGLSALWARAGVCCGPIAPRGKCYPKSLMGPRAGKGARQVRSARERAADARRLDSMSRPSFGGVGALRGGDHEHQHGHQHLRQEAHLLAPGGPR
jgi:hypothetical protein